MWKMKNPFTYALILCKGNWALRMDAIVYCKTTVLEQIGPVGPNTCTINDERYESLLCNQAIPILQQRASLLKKKIYER